MDESLPELTRCRRRRSPIPDCVREILKNSNEPCAIPPELEKSFSEFSFATQPSGITSFSDIISPPCSPMTIPCTISEGEDEEQDFELLNLSPSSMTSGSLISTPTSPNPPTSLSLSLSSSFASSFLSSLSSSFPSSSTSPDQQNKARQKRQHRRRSRRESTHIELDMLTDDVRRVRDGMQESLNRYFKGNSFCAFYTPSAYFRIEFPWWHNLKFSLSRLVSILADLLAAIILQGEKAVEGENRTVETTAEGKGKAIAIPTSKQNLLATLQQLTKEGFDILKIWNARDANLTHHKVWNPVDDGHDCEREREHGLGHGHRHGFFVAMNPRERKETIKATKQRAVQLTYSVDSAVELVKSILIATSTMTSSLSSSPEKEEKDEDN